MSVFIFTDTYPNEYPVEAQVHGTLDTYGSICITIPFDQILGITRMLTLSNIDWRERAASNPQAQRNLNVGQTIGFICDMKTFSIS